MTLKKMTLLASIALALAAFTAPAAAQAEGPAIEGTETYEGNIGFKILLGPAAGSTFSCPVTAHVEGTGGTTAHMSDFTPTTKDPECTGNGVFKNCFLKEDSNNGPWVAHSETDHTLIVTKPEGDVTITNVYEGAECAVATSHLEFGSVKVTPTPTEGAINTLSIDALTTNTSLTTTGTLHKETEASGLMLTTSL